MPEVEGEFVVFSEKIQNQRSLTEDILNSYWVMGNGLNKPLDIDQGTTPTVRDQMLL